MDLEAEVIELKAALAANRRRIRRLSATNIFLAVVVLAFGGATAAYAVTLAPANSVNTAAIIDRTIGTQDVKVGAFAGQTILDNSLTGADINESTLVLPGAGSIVVARIRSTGSQTVSGTEVTIPTSGGSVTQQAGQSLLVAGEVDVNVPAGVDQAGCGGLVFPQLEVFVKDGSSIVSRALKIWQIDGTPPLSFTVKLPGEWILEKSSSTTRTFSVRAILKDCAGKSVTVNAAKVNVFGF